MLLADAAKDYRKDNKMKTFKVRYKTGAETVGKFEICSGEADITTDSLFPKLIFALASNSMGDATSLYEFTDSMLSQDDTFAVEVRLGGNMWVLSRERDYSGLADFPSICCRYGTQLVGDEDADNQFSIERKGDAFTITYDTHKKENRMPKKTSVFSRKDVSI